MSDIYDRQTADALNLKCAGEARTPSGLGTDHEPRRASLRERVESQKDRAYREAVKAERLTELAHLLDKHPDVARILELIDEVRL